MDDKKQQKEKPASNPQLTDDEAAKVVGGMGSISGGVVNPRAPGQAVSDTCTETTDSHMMGCPG